VGRASASTARRTSRACRNESGRRVCHLTGSWEIALCMLATLSSLAMFKRALWSLEFLPPFLVSVARPRREQGRGWSCSPSVAAGGAGG
jgi:hypothetical protein